MKHVMMIILSWFVTAAAYGQAPIIDLNRAIYLEGIIGPRHLGIADRIRGQVDLSKKDIVLLIDSTGGRVDVADVITDAIASAEEAGHRIVCVVTGSAASAAFYIFSHCSERMAIDTAKFMYHAPRISLPLPPPALTYTFLKYLHEDLRKSNDKYILDILDRYPISYKTFKHNFTNEVWQSVEDINKALKDDSDWVKVIDIYDLLPTDQKDGSVGDRVLPAP